MGLYYAFCVRCNRDGSFRSVARDCPKCCGTGKDWRDASELEWFKDWVKGQGAGGRDLDIFYEANPPSTNLFGDPISD